MCDVQKNNHYSITLFNPVEVADCYNMQVITKNELVNENNEDEIMVHTKSNSLYKLLTHTVVNDSVYGKRYLESFSDSHFAEPFIGRIAMDDISHFEVEEAEPLATVGVVLGVSAFAMIVLGAIAVNSVSNDVKSCSQR